MWPRLKQHRGLIDSPFSYYCSCDNLSCCRVVAAAVNIAFSSRVKSTVVDATGTNLSMLGESPRA